MSSLLTSSPPLTSPLVFPRITSTNKWLALKPLSQDLLLGKPKLRQMDSLLPPSDDYFTGWDSVLPLPMFYLEKFLTSGKLKQCIYPFSQFHQLIVSSHGCYLSSFPSFSVHIFLYAYTPAIYYIVILLLYFIIYLGQNMYIFRLFSGKHKTNMTFSYKILDIFYVYMYVCSYLFIYLLSEPSESKLKNLM